MPTWKNLLAAVYIAEIPIFAPAFAQPSFTAPAPVPGVVEDQSLRRAAYLARAQEAIVWTANWTPPTHKPGDPLLLGLPHIAAKLALGQDADLCSARVVELMKTPANDMFWMFPVAAISYLGRDQLTPPAKAAIREAWRTYMPMRGDTENHWVMY